MKKTAAITAAVGATAAVLILAPFSNPPPPAGRPLRLAWDYADAPASVFNVWQSTNLRDWSRIASLSSTSRTFALRADQPAAFFIVSASNTLNCLESSNAPR